MWVIVVCLALVLAGLVAVLRWGGLAVGPPPAPGPDAASPTDPPPVGLVVRRYLWYLVVAVASGATAGILAAGAGGRLVMRLLAVTAGADAQGRITEAEEIVGRITGRRHDRVCGVSRAVSWAARSSRLLAAAPLAAHRAGCWSRLRHPAASRRRDAGS